MKNKFKLFALFAAILALTLTACGGDDGGGTSGGTSGGTDISVASVSLNKTSTTILVNGTEKLTATVAPDNATNKAVTWSTSDPTKATVENGTVTAKAAGTATITVKTVDGDKTATCTVTVSNTAVAVTGVTLTPNTLSLNVNGTQKLTATIAPSGATNQNVTWSTSNAAIATVNEGTVTAKSAGTATITVTTADGNKTATCTVTVTASTPAPTTYTVIYNANGGSGTMANSTHTVGTAQTLTANSFTREGYLFIGWSTNADGTGTVYYNSQSVNNLTTAGNTVNLYAKWGEGNMFYGVTSATALNYVKGTNTVPLAKNAWEGSISSPSNTLNAYIGQINKANPLTVPLLGNNIAFVMTPTSLGDLIIKDAMGDDITSLFTKSNASLDGINYYLYEFTSGSASVNYNLTLGY